VSVGEHNADQYRYDEAYVDYLDVTSPAAGLNASTVVPGQFGFRVLAALATITTSATVANRLVSLDVINANSSTRLRNPMPAVIAASQTNIKCVWSQAWANGISVTNGPLIAPVHELLVPAAWSIQFTVDTIQVADQLASLSLVVLKVPTGA
jgi:hypothetical protein